MADQRLFAAVPRSDVPRATFPMKFPIKTTCHGNNLIPFGCEEVLPGDAWNGNVTIFARMASLLFPMMDNVEYETFFFFVPCRLVWSNWEKFMGEQANPADSISYLIPTVGSNAGGFAINSLYDAFGLPTVGQTLGGNFCTVNALPFRAYNLIYNEWFRDEDLQNSLTVNLGDGPDSNAIYTIQQRGKKHDYFTSARPWVLKGGTQVPLPLAGVVSVVPTTNSIGPVFKKGAGPTPTLNLQTSNAASPAGITGAVSAAWAANDNLNWATPNLQVDLSAATGPTINSWRLALATQQLLEKDARGGTRYTELLRNHFGVTPDDARLQRPEYIGGGRDMMQTQAMPNTNLGSSPLGSLAGQGICNGQHRFSYHATEHGYIIGLINFRGEQTYQNGLRRLWTRSTRYDFYLPVFQNLGEQAIRNDEIYHDGSANDTLAFGYQERWAELRYRPGQIMGLFKSRSAGTIDPWHLAINFAALPVLNSSFIIDATPFARALAAGAGANNMQFLVDSYWDLQVTRALPVRSVPGLTRF
nr:MAG TPA: Capsid protein [Microviridae sp.]